MRHAAHFEMFAYEEMLLSALHFMMLEHNSEKRLGRYRTGGIWITGPPGNPRCTPALILIECPG